MPTSNNSDRLTPLPKCIYRRWSGGKEVFFVSVTIDGLRESLGTFESLSKAEAALKAHRLKALLADTSNAQAVIQTALSDKYSAEQLADWELQLSDLEPTSIIAGKPVGEIPAAVVDSFLAKLWSFSDQ